ncbi:hypothetical protein ACFOQM_12530 [Paenibacillus sp. GCM10012307]|uniref:Uncharacterized protein n=1 Tax=Paenibacillus roseus TaxID=2798579 RepID=A0A934J5T6_9BACL|nr:hypothetical protein [Paenibacillus roseus]MBJ6362118.1 hypothetical protein [Paenibacillus roseus]
MAALADCVQTELFPKATKEDIQKTKSKLSRYRRMKLVTQELERIGIDNLAPKQTNVYNAYQEEIALIDIAVRIIENEKIRKMIELRYIQGERHKVLVMQNWSIHPSTVDRRINKGLESVANSLLLWS